MHKVSRLKRIWGMSAAILYRYSTAETKPKQEVYKLYMTKTSQGHFEYRILLRQLPSTQFGPTILTTSYLVKSSVLIYAKGHRQSLQSETRAITGPAVKGKHLTSALLLLAKVVWDTAANLGKGRAHHFAECSLRIVSQCNGCKY